jgi:hypothetical protein
MLECRLFSKERLTVLQNLPFPLVMKHRINTVEVTRFFKAISNMLQDQPKQDLSP